MAVPLDGAARDSMVGRDRELARVVDLLLQAQGGSGRLLLCTGEAGIGKTRLAEETAAVAAARGVRVVWARSDDRDVGPPFGLWRLALADLAAQDGTAEADPWPIGADHRPSSTVETVGELDRAARFVVFTAVRERLARSAEPAGLLLVLDDIQWADEPSRRLLAHLARQLHRTRVLILANCRVPSVPGEDCTDLIGELCTDARLERTVLTGLPPGAVAALLASSGHPVAAGEATVVWERTGGNPFLVRELARMRAGLARASPGSVPDTVVDATSHRIAQLSGSGQEVLRAAAVVGTGFSIGVVARMLATPVLALLDPVQECQSAGFLVVGDRPGDYRFSHALVQSAVVARLTAAQQRRWHVLAAEAIEQLYSDRLREHLAALAYHRVAGSLPADREKAARACQVAGDVAAEDLAFEDACRLYRQALLVGAEEIQAVQRGELELALAAALYRSGDLAAWYAGLTDLARRAERDSDQVLLARVAVQLDPIGLAGWDSEIGRVCEAALSGPELVGPLRAQVLARYAQVLVYRGDLTRAGEVSSAALQLAERTGEIAALVDALRARQLACSAPERSGERSLIAERMLGAGRDSGSAWIEMWGRVWRIDTLFEAGRLSAIARELAELAGCAARVAVPIARWHLLQYSATHAYAIGRYADALRLAGEAYELMTDMGHPAAFGGHAAILCPIAMHLGYEEAGVTALLDALPSDIMPGGADADAPVVSVLPSLNLALMCLESGDEDRASRMYELAGPVRAWHPIPALRLVAWAQGLAVAIRLGRTDDVAFLASRLEPLRGRHVASSAGAGSYLGPVELHLGKAAAALGALADAVTDLTAATSVCARVGAEGFEVEASVELAATLVRRGEPGDLEQVRALLDVAEPEARCLGLGRFAESLAAIRAGLRTSSASALSPRELEVAALVGRGLTNRQIAANLCISERTAQNHVQHILTKLDFANRAQIAGWVGADAR
jgi:DNA-binding CsgD family transcriptional regulator